jgi:hypothetical protein
MAARCDVCGSEASGGCCVGVQRRVVQQVRTTPALRGVVLFGWSRSSQASGGQHASGQRERAERSERLDPRGRATAPSEGTRVGSTDLRAAWRGRGAVPTWLLVTRLLAVVLVVLAFSLVSEFVLSLELQVDAERWSW